LQHQSPLQRSAARRRWSSRGRQQVWSDMENPTKSSISLSHTIAEEGSLPPRPGSKGAVPSADGGAPLSLTAH
jgi:hypothetical protein